jgi:hypothetical protein
VESEEWYDLSKDPAERRNAPPRAEAAEAVRDRALRRFSDARRRGGPAAAVSLSAEQRERLRALGYVLP